MCAQGDGSLVQSTVQSSAQRDALLLHKAGEPSLLFCLVLDAVACKLNNSARRTSHSTSGTVIPAVIAATILHSVFTCLCIYTLILMKNPGFVNTRIIHSYRAKLCEISQFINKITHIIHQILLVKHI